MDTSKPVTRKPDWLRKKINDTRERRETEKLLRRHRLHTVCEEANCPNRFECFSKKTATFMILGKVCSRRCAFCNVQKGVPENPDTAEPAQVASAVRKLNLNHVVITSVTRDDLDDGGALHFFRVIRAVRELNPGVIVEVLVPDFQGMREALVTVSEAAPEIINHNIETVPRLYPLIRPSADYKRSLELLKSAKTIAPSVFTKSGMMVGLGETADEIIGSLRDLRNVACDMLTIGQYLAPSRNHFPVQEFIRPDRFEKYKDIALDLGFISVASEPFARSSFHAEEGYRKLKTALPGC
jgi:lipoic acid synthetase